MSTFFGNLMSTACVGDFSALAVAWDWPMTARYALSLIGALTVATIHLLAGRELARWAPARADRVIGMLGVIVLPMVLGTAGVILVNLPMPSASVFACVTEASFWFFAAAGTVVAGKDGDNHRDHQSLRWSDGVVALLAIIVVRLMVRGIPFRP